MAREIRTETSWLGETKRVVYDDGEKVGEIHREKPLFGEERDVTYTNGDKVSETFRETRWGEKIKVIRDLRSNRGRK